MIGASFALAAKRAGVADRIDGWDFEDALEAALARGIIDGVERRLESGDATEADLVYLAAPVGAIIDFLRTRGSLLKPGAIVTDAGSTKREICQAAIESLPREAHFVGGHPMAGSHKTGVEFASPDLFQGAPYAIVRDGIDDESSQLRSKALDSIVELVKAIGARPVILTAAEHDRAVAKISHAPQLLSTALAFACGERGCKNAIELAGSGFQDMTRLAESSWSVWEDICRTNSDEITTALAAVIDEASAIRESIASGDFRNAREAFRSANDFMQQLKATGINSTDER